MESLIPDTLAKAILRAALNEDRAAEFLECLFDGGSATIDATSGDLVLLNGAGIRYLRGGT